MKFGSIHDLIDNPRWCYLIICSVVITLYYPTIFAETSKLDDHGMLTVLINTDTLDLKSMFFPRAHGAGYYRPLIGLSYYLDKVLWDISSESMHLHNILLHLLLSLEVFWLCRLLFKNFRSLHNIAFFSALIFAVHPLATESVNWISGRTDLLAGCIMMAGLCLFLSPVAKKSLAARISAILLIAVSGLAKETSLVLFMALPLLIFGINSGNLFPRLKIDKKCIYWFLFSSLLMFSSALFLYNYWLVVTILICSFSYYLMKIDPDVLKSNSGKGFALFISASLFAPGVFWGLRKLAFASDISKVGQTITLIFSDINYTIHLFTGSVVFYIKKAFIPVPLNLAIREIDPGYGLLGGIILLLFFLLFFYRSIFSGLVFAGSVMLLPVLPLAFGTIAWTSHADRYVYLALPFWIIALMSVIFESCIIKLQYFRTLLFAVFFLGFSWTTYARNITWQTNISVFADTVSKSPRFKMMRGLYMSALYDEKMYDEALAQYQIARTLSEIGYDDRMDLLYAEILQAKLKYDEAGWVYNLVLDNSQGKSTGALKGLINYNEKLLADGRCDEAVCGRKIHEYTELLASLSAGLQDDYEIGKKYLRKGQTEKASLVFSSLLDNPKLDKSTRASVEKLMLNVKSKQEL